MTDKWLCGWNRPGCLPDGDYVPARYDSFEAAQRALCADIINYADTGAEEPLATKLDNFAQDVNLWSIGDGIAVSRLGPDGYIYWIMKEH
jgi:hypothetical protein